MESQHRLVRERMKLLLAAHDSEIEPVELTAAPGELLLRQGEPAKRIRTRSGVGPAPSGDRLR
jgi:hypothetical protein